MSVSRSARDPRTLLVLVSLAAALLAACGKKEPPPAAKAPVEVSVLIVAPRDVPAVFEWVAQTQSSRQVDIQARVNGFLAAADGRYADARGREGGGAAAVRARTWVP